MRAPGDFLDLFDVAGYMGSLARCCEGVEEILHSRDEEEEEDEGQDETWSESGVQKVFSGPIMKFVTSTPGGFTIQGIHF